MREYFDLERQIVHLAIDKSVMFERADIDITERLLRDNNYCNLVSCSKIKFAELIGDSMKMYKTARFEEWRKFFEMDRKVSKHLMGNLIDLELTINSRLSHYVSELMINGRLTEYEKNEVILIVSQMRDKANIKFSKYTGGQTWDYIPKMTFGEMKRLVFWLYENKREVYFQVVDGYSLLGKNVRKRFDEINRLRNSLFHLTPLTIYLTHYRNSTKKLNNNERKKVMKWISKLGSHQELRASVREICFHSDKYIAIKNSLHNVG